MEVVAERQKSKQKIHENPLGGGFKYFLLSPLLGEDSHFDQPEKIPPSLSVQVILKFWGDEVQVCETWFYFVDFDWIWYDKNQQWTCRMNLVFNTQHYSYYLRSWERSHISSCHVIASSLISTSSSLLLHSPKPTWKKQCFHEHVASFTCYSRRHVTENPTSKVAGWNSAETVPNPESVTRWKEIFFLRSSLRYIPEV